MSALEVLLPIAVGGMLFCRVIGPLTALQNCLDAMPQNKRLTLVRLDGEMSARVWAPALLLGALPLALLALVVVVIGQLVLYTLEPSQSACRSVEAYLGCAIGVAYLFLVVWMWAFLGYTWEVRFGQRRIRVLRPFKNLAWLTVCYLDCALYAVVVMGLHTGAVYGAVGANCAYSLMSFSFVALWCFWCCAAVACFQLFRIAFAKRILVSGGAAAGALADKYGAHDDDSGPTGFLRNLGKKKPHKPRSEAAVRDLFKVIGMSDDGDSIAAHDLKDLLQELTLKLPKQDQADLRQALQGDDDDGNATVDFDIFWQWYQGYCEPEDENKQQPQKQQQEEEEEPTLVANYDAPDDDLADEHEDDTHESALSEDDAAEKIKPTKKKAWSMMGTKKKKQVAAGDAD